MNALLRRLAAGVALGAVLLASQAQATVTTLTILDGGGTSRNTAWDQDGSSRYFGMTGIYGRSGDYEADVTSAGALMTSDSLASGSVASGAFASGSIASGAMVDLGAKADAAWTSGSGSLIAIAKTIAGANGATGSAAPANAELAGANSSGNLTGIIQADHSAAINISTATTTQLVALSGSTKIYVTAYNFEAAGTDAVTLEYGTGSNCGTGTTILTGAYNLTAQSGISFGSGLGPVLVVPAGNALCALTTAAVQLSGAVAYTQF